MSCSYDRNCRGFDPLRCGCPDARAVRARREIERQVAAQHPGIAPWFVIRTWLIAEGLLTL